MAKSGMSECLCDMYDTHNHKTPRVVFDFPGRSIDGFVHREQLFFKSVHFDTTMVEDKSYNIPSYMKQIRKEYRSVYWRTMLDYGGEHRERVFDYQRLDLTKSEDELYNGIKKERRHDIRKAERNGVKVTTMAVVPDNLQAHSEITKEEQKWQRASLICKQTKLYVASHEGTPINALAFFQIGGGLIYAFAFRDESKMNLCGSSLGIWEAIRDNIGKHDFLDLGIAKGTKYDTVTFFKGRWGETRPLYEYVLR